MSLEFINEHGIQWLRSGCIQFSVSNYRPTLNIAKSNKNKEIIAKLASGERGLTAIYSNYNGESYVEIDKDNNFIVGGGEHGPAFGDIIRLKCNYDENKIEIDKFLNFLLLDNSEID